MNGWIDIQEQLPSTYNDVLLTDGNRIFIGFLEIIAHHHYIWDVGREDLCLNDVKYWMPLPSLPQATFGSPGPEG